MTVDNEELSDVRSFFDAYAEGFDDIYGHTTRRSKVGRWIDRRFRQSMYLRFRDTLDGVRDDHIASVLDIGCGPGRYCVEFLKLGKRVTAIDIAPRMIDLARALCRQDVPRGDITLITGDYLQHRFQDKHDAAVLMGLFDYVLDARPILGKLREDTSRLVLASFPKPAGLFTLQRKLRYRLRNCPLQFYTREDIEALLNATGYERYEISEYDRDFFVRMPVSND